MMLMHALVCAAMLPVLVVAERFFFGGNCNLNFDNYVDPIAHTEQGLQKLKEFASNGAGKLYLWRPFNKEKEQGIKSVQLSFPPLLGTFALTYNRNGSLTPTTTTGSVTYQYLPKQAILLNLPSTSSSLQGIFSFNDKGEADLYPMLISKTDLVLRGCVGVLLGRIESVYVLTNQDYSGLDSGCTRQTIRDKFNGWDVEVAPQ